MKIFEESNIFRDILRLQDLADGVYGTVLLPKSYILRVGNLE